MSKNYLYLIDATAFCYRAFYALKGLATSFGQPTNAIYGFLNILNKILKEKNPQYLAVCFDVSRDTFRQKKFAEYKIQRPPMPDGLSSQIPLIKEILLAYGIPVFEKAGFEADDIIATIASKAKEEEVKVVVVSSDKDILQLVDDDTAVLSPHKEGDIVYDQEKVLERFGVGPGHITDIISLAGDDVDNIPGVPGIGEKTAVDLIKKFGSLQAILDNLQSLKQEKLKSSIKDNIDRVILNKELAVLKRDVDIDFDLAKTKIAQPNYNELSRLFRHLEFKSLVKGLPIQEDVCDIKLDRLTDAQAKERIDSRDLLWLYGSNLEDMVFSTKGGFFSLSNPGSNIKAILEDPAVQKVSHNLKRIKVSLGKDNIAMEGLYFDTMVAAYLLDPSRPAYGLVDIAWDYLKNASIPKAPDNLQALDLIMRLREHLDKGLNDKSLISLFHELEMPLTGVLADMEATGIKLDTKLLSELSVDLEKRLIKLIEDIYKISGFQFNINSPKQLRDVLFEKLKLPVVKRSKTGPSTDEGVLRALADKHELPAFLLEYRQLIKLKNTYIDALPLLVDPRTNRIHSSFNQTGTETGRLSSSNPNLQNIPVKTDIGRKIRQAIIAFDETSVLVSCDYSQIELRILAHLSKDESLISAFRNNEDIHKATASLIYGLAEKDVAESMREAAKRVNFGIIYGLSAYGLSRDLGLSIDEAQRFIDAYFLKYPGVKEYIDKQIKKAEQDGFVTTLLGRRRYIPQINDKSQALKQFAQRQAVNTPIQGTAADLIKLAMVNIHNEIKQKKLKSEMIIQIHDELVFNVAKDRMQDFIILAKERMEHVLTLDVPIKVDMKIGQNWLDMVSLT